MQFENAVAECMGLRELVGVGAGGQALTMEVVIVVSFHDDAVVDILNAKFKHGKACDAMRKTHLQALSASAEMPYNFLIHQLYFVTGVRR